MYPNVQPTSEGPLKQGMVYVSIPAERPTGGAHPPVQINNSTYLAGGTYQVTPDIGSEIERLKTNFLKGDLGLVSDRINTKALQQILGTVPPTAQVGNFGSVMEGSSKTLVAGKR